MKVIPSDTPSVCFSIGVTSSQPCSFSSEIFIVGVIHYSLAWLQFYCHFGSTGQFVMCEPGIYLVAS